MAQVILSIFTLFNTIGAYMQEIDIISALPFSSEIVLSYNSSQTNYTYETKEYNEILHSFISMAQGGHQMPAFGVAINEEVETEKQQGMFVEFIFNTTQLFNDMPFDALLVQVEPDWSGFNLIRKTEGKYQGRCFYYNLQQDKNMQPLYETILTILNINK